MINRKPTKFRAISELVGGGISGADDGTLMEYRGKTPPTEAEIDAKFKSMLDDWEAKQYQRDRSISYPSLQDQLDMLYWDRKNGTKTWEESIDKVKADNPKPE